MADSLVGPQLAPIEALILAQAVWELGATDWPAVATILSQHPLLARHETFFTPQSCHAMYLALMNEANLECTEATKAVHSSINLKLAQKHYQARVEELRDLIAIEETKFKTILVEIGEIKSGLWDDKIKEQLVTQEEENEQVHAILVPQIPSTDEVFDGSDLSGVTDSGSPPAHESPGEDINIDDATAPGTATPPEKNLPESVNEKDIPEGEVLPEVTKTPPPMEVEADELNISDENPTKVEVATEPEPQNEPAPESPTPDSNHPSPPGLGDQDQTDEIPVASEATGREQEVELVSTHASPAPLVPADVTSTADTMVIEPEPEPEPRVDVLEELSGLEELNIASPDKGVVETPTVDVESPEDDGNTSGEEPLQVTRRSTRRRIASVSSAPPAKTRGRGRRKTDTSRNLETSPALEVEPSPDVDIQADSPRIEEDEPVPSPQAPDTVSTRRREGKRKASVIEGTESPRDKKRARDDSEPAEEDDPGPSANISRTRRRGDRTEEQVALKRFQNVIGMLHSQISQHRNGNIFHNPIKNSEAPDYHEIVKRPIDLKTIKMKVKDGAIANSLEYRRDIYLMFANALMYNRPGSDVYSMAEDMMVESEGYIHSYRQTEGFVRGAHRV